MKKTLSFRHFGSSLLLALALVTSFSGANNRSASAISAPYNPEIGSKIVTRCDLIKDYLAKTVRIDELAARQNKVRGWEYVLRRLGDMDDSYGKFSVDYSELSATLSSLRQQLEQFKIDFEAYDGEFQKLLGTDCKADPEGFWRQLDVVRSFRSGITLSSDSYKASLAATISKEGAKW